MPRQKVGVQNEQKLDQRRVKDQSPKKENQKSKTAGGNISREGEAGRYRERSCSDHFRQERDLLSLDGKSESGISFKEIKRSDDEYATKQ